MCFFCPDTPPDKVQALGKGGLGTRGQANEHMLGHANDPHQFAIGMKHVCQAEPGCCILSGIGAPCGFTACWARKAVLEKYEQNGLDDFVCFQRYIPKCCCIDFTNQCPGGTCGLILAPWSEILCLYTEDAGSGGKVNGGCGGGQLTPEFLEDQMKRQRYGKFNEAIVGGLFWERNLPHVIDAIMFTTSSYWEEVLGRPRAVDEGRARRVHSAFESQYGVRVPLVRFTGHVFEAAEWWG